jgi:hypothetical protein
VLYRVRTAAGLILDPLSFDMTREGLRAIGMEPVVANDDWELRLQILDETGAAVGLTSALVIMTVKKAERDSTALLSRRSDTDITGSSPARKQIAIDATQSSETGDTGKGWILVRFGRETADADAIEKAVGVQLYDLQVKLSAGTIRTVLRGKIELFRSITDPVV